MSHRNIRNTRPPVAHRSIHLLGKGTLPQKPEPIVRNNPPGPRKTLLVLDTNVLMHDPVCIFKFQEHDVMVLMQVLEELDNHKKGTTDTNRNTREAIRLLSAIFGKKARVVGDSTSISSSLFEPSRRQASGTIHLREIKTEGSKVDNQVLDAIDALRKENKWASIRLVSKDVALRLKATIRGITAEDYLNDIVLEGDERLYSGVFTAPSNFMNRVKVDGAYKKGPHAYSSMRGGAIDGLSINQFINLGGPMSEDLRVVSKDSGIVLTASVTDYSEGKKGNVYGIHARNREQNYVLNLLMDPNVHLVTIAGGAGSGKTLLTIASGLEQVVEQRIYSDIIFTRETIPMGEDIGFLPGTEEEKMAPWLGALHDNLEVLLGADTVGKEGSKASKQDQSITDLLVRSRIKLKSTAFMRGRTFIGRFLIIDESQNLSHKQVKALVTRAGPGTKVVCLGNLEQIDTPYLTAGSSGFAFLIERMRGWKHYGHITLASGERSPLATEVNTRL